MEIGSRPFSSHRLTDNFSVLGRIPMGSVYGCREGRGRLPTQGRNEDDLFRLEPSSAGVLGAITRPSACRFPTQPIATLKLELCSDAF